MKHAKHTTKDLQAKLLEFGLSKAYAHQLSTGRRTPSMKMAGQIMQKTGIKPEVWIELNRKYEATK